MTYYPLRKENCCYNLLMYYIKIQFKGIKNWSPAFVIALFFSKIWIKEIMRGRFFSIIIYVVILSKTSCPAVDKLLRNSDMNLLMAMYLRTLWWCCPEWSRPITKTYINHLRGSWSLLKTFLQSTCCLSTIITVLRKSIMSVVLAALVYGATPASVRGCINISCFYNTGISESGFSV